MKTVDAEIVPRDVQSQVGEMTLTAGEHELKVVVHVESTKGGSRNSRARSGTTEQATQTRK